jgi:hypothetical protein
MTNGQIQQLQDLSRCYMLPGYSSWVKGWLLWAEDECSGQIAAYKLPRESKAILRRLTHQYRNQIAAVKRNQAAQ